MPLGEIVRFWAAIDYSPELSFYDSLFNKVATKQRDDYEHWWTNRLAVILHDHKRHELLNIGHKRTVCEMVMPEDLHERAKEAGKRLRAVVRDMRVARLTRMGVDLVVMADCGLSYQETVDQLTKICLSSDGRVQEITTEKAIGAGLHYDYEWQGATAELRVVAMEKEAGMSMIHKQGDHQKLFRPVSEGDDLWSFYQRIPESFIFFDMEVYREEDCDPEEWREFARDATDHASQVFEGIRSLVLETR